MNESEEVASAVQSILRTARSRTTDHPRRHIHPRSLSTAIETTAADHTPLIAEIKPTSPTTETVDNRDPVTLAKQMVAGGATALSVLTEPTHFGGSPETLQRIRETVDVPILRKDFLLEESHLDTVAADIVLLITRFIDDLESMLAAARDRGYQALVEVHTQAELTTAIGADADIIGINARDLTTLTIDHETVTRLAPQVPDEITVIAESGVTSPHHIRQYRTAGADAILVGSTIMAAADVTTRTRELVTA